MPFIKLIFREAKIFFLCIGISCICANTFAAEYYVSPSGSASWSECTDIKTPCSAKTAMQNAQAGDTVYFRGGTYVNDYVGTTTPKRWTCGLPAPSHSGTAENPIIFKAYPNEIPFIDNSANAGLREVVASFGTHYQDYIIWDGFHTKVVLCVGYEGPGTSGDGRGWGAQIHGSDHTIIRNCDIEGNPGGLSNCHSIRMEHATYHEVYNNKLYGSSLGTLNSTGTTSYNSSHGNIHHNDVYNNAQGLYDKQSGEYNIYHHNFIHNNQRGFTINSAASTVAHDIKCYQNVFINNSGDAIHVRGSIAPYDNYIYNNTIITGSAFGILTCNKSIHDTEIYNNILYGCNNSLCYLTTGTVSLSDYNTFYNAGVFTIGTDWGGVDYNTVASWQTATGFDQQSKTNNPNFINPGGTNPEDYKRTSYPQDGRGGSYASVMGAYITGNEVIGCSAGASPSPPSSPPSSPPNFSAN